MKIVQYPLPKACYYDEVQPKRLIILHHTAGASAKSSIDWWKSQTNKVATTVVIDRDGTIYQAFPFDRWANALGIKQETFDKFGVPNINRRLDQISIQIELANWGILTQKNGKYYTFTNREIAKENVTTYQKPFKGSRYYESYTKAQVEALRKLILHLEKQFPQIKLDYQEKMWEVSRDALVGNWGIWTHVSYREDKSDCHPQPELINMLKNLHKKENKSMSNDPLIYEINTKSKELFSLLKEADNKGLALEIKEK